MEQKERHEEILSRREFFKNVAKRALPFIATVALVSNPIVAKEVEEVQPSGCDWSCTGGCKASCGRQCS